ncbi:oxidoreductase [Paenibacillus selenitireducens]|uniref:Oxidoreductase n=1 Tax=Paenibacillus selenitireducens TaxID=1324314 RepID=A0A1T2XHB6_9BACL|nr:SDR family oxidoreductase [Paenibacillus selenitireducens]OPA79260.1 oxidoreductase [Paenibacillus selenitireducens]
MPSSNQVGIITGGASGIGRAIGKELARRGVYVMLADKNAEEGENAVQEIQAQGGNARFIKVDVSDAKQMHTAVHAVYEEFGRLDYMFNNAGISMYGEVYDMTLEHWERIMNVNVWGVIHGIQAAYPLMKQQGFGHIANTASATGLGPSPTAAAYATTKHAIVGLTTSLHYEAEAFGIKVSALCPAFVDTSIFERGEAISMDKALINEQVKKQKPMSPEKFAVFALKGLERNQPIVCPMPLRRTMDIFFTLFPSVHRKLMRLVCRVARKARVEA